MGEPIRTCNGCRKRSSKDKMVRYAFYNGEWIVSLDGKGEGRGGYVHNEWSCIEKALQPKQIERVMRKKKDQRGITEAREVLQKHFVELCG